MAPNLAWTSGSRQGCSVDGCCAPGRPRLSAVADRVTSRPFGPRISRARLALRLIVPHAAGSGQSPGGRDRHIFLLLRGQPASPRIPADDQLRSRGWSRCGRPCSRRWILGRRARLTSRARGPPRREPVLGPGGDLAPSHDHFAGLLRGPRPCPAHPPATAEGALAPARGGPIPGRKARGRDGQERVAGLLPGTSHPGAITGPVYRPGHGPPARQGKPATGGGEQDGHTAVAGTDGIMPRSVALREEARAGTQVVPGTARRELSDSTRGRGGVTSCQRFAARDTRALDMVRHTCVPCGERRCAVARRARRTRALRRRTPRLADGVARWEKALASRRPRRYIACAVRWGEQRPG
jgi:hypothetical protein